MLARVLSCAVVGLDGVIVEVEVDTAQGLPGTDIVGLPDAARPRTACVDKFMGGIYQKGSIGLML